MLDALRLASSPCERTFHSALTTRLIAYSAPREASLPDYRFPQTCPVPAARPPPASSAVPAEPRCPPRIAVSVASLWRLACSSAGNVARRPAEPAGPGAEWAAARMDRRCRHGRGAVRSGHRLPGQQRASRGLRPARWPARGWGGHRRGPAGTPPDISNMSPKERYDRLYNRVMRAAESGDQATVAVHAHDHHGLPAARQYRRRRPLPHGHDAAAYRPGAGAVRRGRQHPSSRRVICSAT